ncbi:MAG: hypothetical protein AAB573_00785 [Patescibacteria group bacterium]
MNNIESDDFNHASPFGEGTGIDDSIEGLRKKKARALLDATRATGALSLLVNPRADVLDMAKYKIRDAESRARFWGSELKARGQV